MIQLHVLGRTDLYAVDQGAAADLLAQPRPLALLVYLAVAHSGQYARRDSLVGLFWAETGQEQARASLRRLLHTIRRTLGPDVIDTRGDEEVRVNTAALWCDAAECGACFADGRLDRAIALYKGPMLPGFILAGAHSFQDWIDMARRQLNREAVKAAVKLAEAHAAANEHSRAGDLAQFITVIAPDFDDEHQLRKLLRVLHRQGNRVAALRLFDDFSRRLHEAYGTTPAVETRNLISEIRSG